jgi:hypothetical protein
LRAREHERRRELDVVAHHAVDRAGAGIGHEAARQGLERDGPGHLAVGRERGPGLAIRHELEPDHHPQAPGVSDDRVPRHECVQPGQEVRADLARVADEVVLLDVAEDGQPDRGGDRVPRVGVTAHEVRAVPFEGLDELVPDDDGA